MLYIAGESILEIDVGFAALFSEPIHSHRLLALHMLVYKNPRRVGLRVFRSCDLATV